MPDCEASDDLPDSENVGKIAEIMDIVDSVQSSHPIAELTNSGAQEWCSIDKDVDVEPGVTDAELIRSVVEPQHELVDSEADSDAEEDATEKIGWAAASAAFDTIVKFMERQKTFTANECMQIHLLHQSFLKKKHDSKRRMNIRDMFKK